MYIRYERFCFFFPFESNRDATIKRFGNDMLAVAADVSIE